MSIDQSHLTPSTLDLDLFSQHIQQVCEDTDSEQGENELLDFLELVNSAIQDEPKIQDASAHRSRETTPLAQKETRSSSGYYSNSTPCGSPETMPLKMTQIVADSHPYTHTKIPEIISNKPIFEPRHGGARLFSSPYTVPKIEYESFVTDADMTIEVLAFNIENMDGEIFTAV